MKGVIMSEEKPGPGPEDVPTSVGPDHRRTDLDPDMLEAARLAQESGKPELAKSLVEKSPIHQHRKAESFIRPADFEAKVDTAANELLEKRILSNAHLNEARAMSKSKEASYRTSVAKLVQAATEVYSNISKAKDMEKNIGFDPEKSPLDNTEIEHVIAFTINGIEMIVRDWMQAEWDHLHEQDVIKKNKDEELMPALDGSTLENFKHDVEIAFRAAASNRQDDNKYAGADLASYRKRQAEHRENMDKDAA